MRGGDWLGEDLLLALDASPGRRGRIFVISYRLMGAELVRASLGSGDAAAITGRGEVVILCGQLAGPWGADPIVRRARDIAGCPVAVGRVPWRRPLGRQG